jgi:hypothetical protein
MVAEHRAYSSNTREGSYAGDTEAGTGDDAEAADELAVVSFEDLD